MIQLFVHIFQQNSSFFMKGQTIMKNTQSKEKLLITPAEACEILGIGRTTMYRLIHEETVPVVRFPHCRKLYLSVDSLKQMIFLNTSSSSNGGEDNE